MRRERHREAGLLRDILRHNRRRGLVHLQPAVLLRNIDRRQPKLRRLLQQPPRNREVLRLNRIGRRHNLVDGEVRGRLRNLLLLIGEILRKETVRRRRIADEKTPPGMRFVSAIGAVIVAMVLLLLKSELSIALNSASAINLIRFEKLSTERHNCWPFQRNVSIQLLREIPVGCSILIHRLMFHIHLKRNSPELIT